MSEHCCGCPPKVIVRCDSTGSESKPPGGENGGQQTPPEQQPPSDPRPCNRVLLRVNSVRVSKSETYGVTGEWFDAQWRLTVSVNDQSRTWRHDHVKDNMIETLAWDFMIDLVAPSTTIAVRSSGFEEDLLINDQLPSAEQTHGSADNWGIGATRQLRGSDQDFVVPKEYMPSSAWQLHFLSPLSF